MLPNPGPIANHINNPMRAVCSGPLNTPNLPVGFVPGSMLDASELLGSPVSMSTFGLTVGDLDGDQQDDIILGSHAFVPRLLLNSSSGFIDASDALKSPRKGKMDTHAHTLFDFDGDGDLDLAIASGGADGVGAGAPNMLYRNDSKNGQLEFTQVDPGAEFTVPKARSRAFIPLASPDGNDVDLLFTARLRDGYPNKLLRDIGGAAAPIWRVDAGSYLSRPLNDRGRGVVADFDNDQRNDYLVLEQGDLQIIWHPEAQRKTTTLAKGVFSLVAADFNNDAKLDIFAGRFSYQVQSDRVSQSKDKLIYAVYNSKTGANKSISFFSPSALLSLDLIQHVRKTEKQLLRAGEDIYLGRDLLNPEKRRFKILKSDAIGQPASFESPGVYVWYSEATDKWHIRWQFYPDQNSFKGLVEAEDIASLQEIGIEETLPEIVSDLIFFNKGEGEFSTFCSVALDHPSITSSATVADFNNDGWLDIAGVRHADAGAENLQPFLLTNVSGRDFVLNTMELREADKLSSSDLIAHGFFNSDDKPDLIMTNGFGQPPSNKGIARLLLNNTATENRAIILRLQGASANRLGIGAKLTLTDANKNMLGYRIQGLNTNISQDTHWLHFGLGEAPGPYLLSVEWPDGMRTNHEIPGAGQFVFNQDEKAELPDNLGD